MRADSPSQTAFATTWLRVLHLIVDEPPFVFEDRVAARMLPAYLQRYLRRLERLPLRWLKRYRSRWPLLTSMRGHIVVRARYVEDQLDIARQARLARHLILAAGLDTFALRQMSRLDRIHAVEIDHPATQRWKAQWLDEHESDDIPDLEMLPVDFEKATLGDALGHWQPEPQFISWLGTTYYLSEAAIINTLASLADCSATGSHLVLDFWQDSWTPDLSSMLLTGTKIATALQREPMKTFFRPDSICRLARQSGWEISELCTPEMQTKRYLNGRSDGLSVPGFAYLLHLEK